MLAKTLNDVHRLAHDVYKVRDRIDDNYVLIVGAGTSSVRGRPFLETLVKSTLMDGSDTCDDTLGSQTTPDEWNEFNRVWPGLANAQRTEILSRICHELTPCKGHMELAFLLKNRCFPLVLTTTLDKMIEFAFVKSAFDVGVPLPRFRSVLTRPQSSGICDDVFRNARREMVIAQLYGWLDVNGQVREFPLTELERQQHLAAVAPSLRQVLGRDLILVGFTRSDWLLLRHFPNTSNDGTVYYVGSDTPDMADAVLQPLTNRPRKAIVDPDLDWDTFFEMVARRFETLSKAEEVRGQPLAERTIAEAAEGEEQKPEDQILVELIATERADQDAGPAPSSTELLSLVESTGFTIRIDGEGRVSSSMAGGRFAYTGSPPALWLQDVDSLNEAAHDLGLSLAAYHALNDQQSRDRWRRQAKREGQNLYRSLMAASGDIQANLQLARRVVPEPENLTLVFNAPREHLGVPFELMQEDAGLPLAIRHPFCRQVSGLNIRHAQGFDATVRSLGVASRSLKFLLIGSNTGGGIDPDGEISQLREVILERASRAKVAVSVDLMPTAEADLTNVRRRLSRCHHHVVHFSGHGEFDERQPEQSGFVLWKERGGRGGLGRLTASNLATLMEGSETRLFFSSACLSARQGSGGQLLGGDFLGVLDALVQAGIPYVVGFRWYVTESGSRQFARLFYQHLMMRPFVPERAAWHARNEIYSADTLDETWTSPLVVSQTPYYTP